MDQIATIVPVRVTSAELGALRLRLSEAAVSRRAMHRYNCYREGAALYGYF